MTQVLVEEHRCVRDWPREIYVLSEALRSSDTILQSSLIEHIRRELRKAGMHSVLNLKADRAVPKYNKPLEERLS